jgi:hypothetical protein
MYDPIAVELTGYKVPSMMSKDERKELRAKMLKKLERVAPKNKKLDI